VKKLKKENSDGNELSLKNEIFAILSLFLSFFLIFSLVSFTPLDPSFFRSAHGRVVYNFGGRVGAELAAFSFNLFGMASMFFILIAFLTAESPMPSARESVFFYCLFLLRHF
jgi:hypothetical protein